MALKAINFFFLCKNKFTKLEFIPNLYFWISDSVLIYPYFFPLQFKAINLELSNTFTRQKPIDQNYLWI